jgi:hypothetical protein
LPKGATAIAPAVAFGNSDPTRSTKTKVISDVFLTEWANSDLVRPEKLTFWGRFGRFGKLNGLKMFGK